jgi:hypothetical protein
MTTTAQWDLLSACLAYLRLRPDLGSFAEPIAQLGLDAFETKFREPNSIPVESNLNAFASCTNETTNDLMSAILAASSDMVWNQTYSKEEVGADFLENYGWCDVISPEGPFFTDCNRRLMIGVWGQGLDYQAHWHDPAEVYVPIVGSATFWTQNTGHHIAGIGDAVFHTSNEKHATNFDQSPFIALILWQADDLSARLQIEDRKTGATISPPEIK